MTSAALLLAIAGVASEADTTRIAELEFASKVLGRSVPYVVVTPENSTTTNGAVLFLLHGRGRNHRSLVDSPAARQVLLQSPFFVVLPMGEDGWYVNSPVAPEARYEDYLLEVLREAGFRLPLSRDPRLRAIAGWSMGGYGAVRFAGRHPEEVGTVASIIGLLDFPRPPNSKEDGYAVPTARFGTDEDLWKKFNPIHDIDAFKGRRILVLSATEAFDRGMNVRFAAALSARGIAHETAELPGGHKFSVVEAALPRVIDFCARSFAPFIARR